MIRLVAVVAALLLLAAAPVSARTLRTAPPPLSEGVAVTGPSETTLSADHPTLPVRYTALAEVELGRATVLVEDVTDPTAPVVVGQVTVGAVMTPRSVAVDPAGERLYVAVSTNTHVLDLGNAVRPVQIGRLSDYMIRNHESVQVAEVVDPELGPRRILLIASRLGGGQGCWTGTVHVYDVTGDQRDQPVTVLESEVPRVADGEACPNARLLLDGADRRLRLAWSADRSADGTDSVQTDLVQRDVVRTDIVRYDTTAEFINRVGVCAIVPAA